MSAANGGGAIRLRGVRHNNLKNFDLDLPLHRLIVVTGVSGSGKSSLAFDTLFAEGQRRYIETFSPYARQFFDRMDKPAVDSVEGIPPAIAIEQRNAVRTTRSTVGTMTEICDYLKVVWPHVAALHCRQCGKPVEKEPPHRVWEMVNAESASAICETANPELFITFDLPLTEKLALKESLDLIAKQGYQRLWVNGEIVRLDDAVSDSTLRIPHSALTIVQDRLRLAPENRARFIEACEQAYHFGKGKLAVRPCAPASAMPHFFSNRFHCAQCDFDYREPSPALFSFNHPVGACPTCKGFGRIIGIDYDLAIPDRSLALAGGAIKPWRTGTGAESQDDLAKFCKKLGVPMDVPFRELSAAHQRWVIEGDAGYNPNDPANSWPKKWYGVKGYFRWLESKSYKMHVRVLLSRYRAYTKCPDCDGKRFQPEALLYRMRSVEYGVRNESSAPSVDGDSAHHTPHLALTLADFYALPVSRALEFIEALAARHSALRAPHSALAHAIEEVRSRLAFLAEVGLGYLTLDRPTRTLSGGETERVNLTTCLGTRLVNTLFVLDEPSVGLHPRDTERLVRILERLRDTGNTVVVVEHEAAVMRAADQIVDLGPASGERGGEVIFQGGFGEVLRDERSLTGAYLSGWKRIEIPAWRPVDADTRALTLSHAAAHNLRDLTVRLPLNRFVVVTGVSGSGKTTLVHDCLLPALTAKLQSATQPIAKASDRLDSGSTAESSDEPEADSAPASTRRPTASVTGAEQLSRVILVDQSPLGKTPRSNPAVYIGAFDDIRELFAQSEAARQRGLNASAFSFNSAAGQCERCRGAGFEKVEMQFLSDVFIKCPECGGRRYRTHILEIKVRSAEGGMRNEALSTSCADNSALRIPRSAIEWSIADLLDATVEDAIAFLATFADSRPAQRAADKLHLLQEVGLGYLRLGQPINTLSGGESQRLKLVAHLAENEAASEARGAKREARSGEARSGEAVTSPLAPHGSTLFLFDEPTTGLHFDDVRVLLKVFQRLVDAGHSVLVVEHNLDVIKCADWLVDLGPDAGEAGGRIIAEGTPEQVAAGEASHTGRFLRALLQGTISTA